MAARTAGASPAIAVVASSNARTLVPRVPVGAVGPALIIIATVSQAFDLRWSKGTQDALAIVKALLIGGFIVVGVVLGAHTMPTWRPPEGTTDFVLRPFAVSLVYIAFAFSGWNTAIYAAEEFRDPRRTVARAMLLGTALVTFVYLVVNAIFVANLTGARLVGWLREDTSRITLAHLLMDQLAGARAARLASLFVVLSLASSVISMTLVGPRVSAVMAHEGFLPSALAGREGRPPFGSVLLQSGLALALLATHGFEELLRSVGAILTLTSGLTVAAVLRLRFTRTAYARPSLFVVLCALVYTTGSAWMLWFTLTESPRTLIWLAVVTAAAAIGYLVAARHRVRPGPR